MWACNCSACGFTVFPMKFHCLSVPKIVETRNDCERNASDEKQDVPWVNLHQYFAAFCTITPSFSPRVKT